MKKVLLSYLMLLASLFSYAQIEQPVTWSYAAKKINANEAILYLKANIDPTWHLYSQFINPGGPVKTTFSFAPSKAFSLVGGVKEPKPIQKQEKVFNMVVGYFEESAVFQQRVKLKSKKPFAVKGKVEFMVCNDTQCLPPAEVEFNIPVK